MTLQEIIENNVVHNHKLGWISTYDYVHLFFVEDGVISHWVLDEDNVDKIFTIVRKVGATSVMVMGTETIGLGVQYYLKDS